MLALRYLFGQAFTWAVVSLVLFVQVSHSTTYPWVEMGTQDLVIITNPTVETRVRLELIKRAQKTLDLATFDQRADCEIGMPLIEELEKALERGVKVRLISNRVARYLKDPARKAYRLLRNLARKYQNFTFIEVGGLSSGLMSRGILDGSHEKLLIVDHRIGLGTGRGHAGEYQQWLDNSFTFKGPLVQQAETAYDVLWRSSRIVQASQFGRVNEDYLWGQSKSPSSFGEEDRGGGPWDQVNVNWHDESEAEFFRLLQWFDQGPEGGTLRARLLHHNLLQLVAEGDPRLHPLHLERRVRDLSDPVVESVLARIATAHEIRFYVLAMTLHPKIQAALIEAMYRGARVEIFTNDDQAHKRVVPISFPFGWFIGIDCMDRLLGAGAKVFGLDQTKPIAWRYLHRKMVQIDNTVYVGSHNLTLPSTAIQDEMTFEIESPMLAAEVKNIFAFDRKASGQEFDPARIHLETISSRIRQIISKPLRWMY